MKDDSVMNASSRQTGYEIRSCAAGWTRSGGSGSGCRSLNHTEDGNTILAGGICDQPALFGVLEKIRDMGVELLSVKQSKL